MSVKATHYCSVIFSCLPGLMPNIAPPGSKRDPNTRYKWKKCNTYFDESTIKDVRSIVEVRKKRATKLE
jgi:hypothetical protein